MTSSTAITRHRGPIVGLLALLWVTGLLALAWWWFTIGMQLWAANYSDGQADAEGLRQQNSLVLVIMILVGVGGPAVIALVAHRLRLVRTAVVFLVLAVALGIPGLPLAARAYRDATPQPAPPPPANHCQELSGGDNRCPGD